MMRWLISLFLCNSYTLRTPPLHIPFLLVTIAVLASSCGTRAYQNVNARYNGYFYANEYVNEVYQEIEDAYEYDFNDLLRIYPEIDSSTIQGNKEKLDDAFKKSSQVIEWYPSSDWVDDNYLVIGKIRYLRAEFQFAVETFQYVYNKSKDAPTRQRALLLLMRTYMDMGELDLTYEVMDFIEEEQLTVDNAITYKMQQAFLHQRLSEIDEMQTDLTAVVNYIPERDQRGRANFILGQLAERSGDFPQALGYYQQAIKGNPPYELLFHTEIRKLAVTNIQSEEDVARAYKTYNKLLKDGKNREYQDKIYYSMGRLEQRRKEYQKAITNYLKALEVEEPNPRTQGLASLRIAQIYYDEYENYRFSSTYYDSTVLKLPETEPGYERIQERQIVLKDLVTELNIIDKNDSLLALSELSPVQLDAYLDQYLNRLEAQEAEENERKRKRDNSFSGANTAIDNPTNIPSDGTWYFYNVAAVGQGQQEFQRNWGNRALEDDWRRSQKISIVSSDDNAIVTNTEESVDEPEETTDNFDRSGKKEVLMATVPRSVEEKAQLNMEVANALFNAGRIYRFGLEREDLSEETYLELLRRYPDSDLRLETLYALYTLNEEKNSTLAEQYKGSIIQDYPDSLITKLLINPNYLVEQEQRNQELQLVYKDIYQVYEQGDYQKADQMITQALAHFEDVDFLQNVELLAAIIKGRTEGLFSYEQKLQAFSEKYPEGELHDYALFLLEKINPAKEEIATPEDQFEFSEDFKQLHLIGISFNTSLNSMQTIKAFIETFNQENFSKQRLSVGFLNFNKDEQSGMLFINSFKTKSAAITYNLALGKALEDLDRQSDPIFHNFAISRDNFTLLFQSKKLDDYLKFNKRFYQ
jgi:tetratricopeptide (TPR) repeat protein